MTDDDVSNLRAMADRLSADGFYAYVRHDGDIPILFALGAKKCHSIDLRRKDGGLVIEYWHGHPDDDFISEQAVPTFEAAITPIAAWLSRDAA